MCYIYDCCLCYCCGFRLLLFGVPKSRSDSTAACVNKPLPSRAFFPEGCCCSSLLTLDEDENEGDVGGKTNGLLLSDMQIMFGNKIQHPQGGSVHTRYCSLTQVVLFHNYNTMKNKDSLLAKDNQQSSTTSTTGMGMYSLLTLLQ